MVLRQDVANSCWEGGRNLQKCSKRAFASDSNKKRAAKKQSQIVSGVCYRRGSGRAARHANPTVQRTKLADYSDSRGAGARPKKVHRSEEYTADQER